MRCYLGIDNGGTVTKAALYTQEGVELAVEAVKTEVFGEHAGFMERDMDQMREANYAVIRNLLARTGIAATDIAGIACTGHGKGLYLWGKDGRPVRPGILSTDNRAWEYPLRWQADGTADKVFAKTYQQILACQPVSLLAWLKDHEPDCIPKIQWIFECKDYVRFCLTGEAFAELTDYSGANLVNLETRAYDDGLLALFALEELRGCLPPLKASIEVCGLVSAEAAGQTGLAEGTPVMGGMFDIDACAVAVGVASPEHICMIAGTWSINEYVSPTPVKDKSVMMNSLFCLPAYYLIEECSPTSAGNFEWFVHNLLPELAAQAKAEGRNVYKVADEWVDGIPISETCPIFLPFLMASNAHPLAKATFVGLDAHHGRAQLVKSIYEGVAFSHKYHLDRLLKSRSTPVRSIRLAGGVANSPQWVRIFADVLGYPIEIVDIKETGTLGCAMNVAVSLGDYADFEQAAARMIKVREPVVPVAANVAVYAQRDALYKRILEALDPIWNDMRKVTDGK